MVADVGDSLAVLGREEGDAYVGEIGESRGNCGGGPTGWLGARPPCPCAIVCTARAVQKLTVTAMRLLSPFPTPVSVRHFGGDEGERQRLQEQCGESVSIAAEDGYLTVEEGRLRVSTMGFGTSKGACGHQRC